LRDAWHGIGESDAKSDAQVFRVSDPRIGSGASDGYDLAMAVGGESENAEREVNLITRTHQQNRTRLADLASDQPNVPCRQNRIWQHNDTPNARIVSGARSWSEPPLWYQVLLDNLKNKI
jgi:hypothetical protein